jgi:hypothetical protein
LGEVIAGLGVPYTDFACYEGAAGGAVREGGADRALDVWRLVGEYDCVEMLLQRRSADQILFEFGDQAFGSRLRRWLSLTSLVGEVPVLRQDSAL